MPTITPKDLKKFEKILSSIKEHRRNAFTLYSQIEAQVNEIFTILAACPEIDQILTMLSEEQVEESEGSKVDISYIEVFRMPIETFAPAGENFKQNYENALVLEKKAKNDIEYLDLIMKNLKKFKNYFEKTFSKKGMNSSQKQSTENVLMTLLSTTREITSDFHDYLEQTEKYVEACQALKRG